MADEIKLYVNGQEFSGWKDVSVSRAITAVAGKFEMSITDSWDVSGGTWSIRPGQSCVVKIGNDSVITGYVESVETSVSGNERSIRVSGRDKTCDLVDCSLPPTNLQSLNIDLFKYAQKLCAPFGITVIAKASVGAVVPTHNTQTGESIHTELETWSRRRGVLLTTDGLGRLIILRPGDGDRAKTALVQGENLKKISLNLDHSKRFRNYLVKTQIPALDDVSIPDAWSGIDASCVDNTIKRNRPLLILAEQGEKTSEMKTRIQWEAAHRAAEGMAVDVEVVGWRQIENGPLWDINQRVNVEASAIGIKLEMIVGEVTYVQSESDGTVAKMKLALKDAYQPKPEIDPPVWGDAVE